MKSQINQQNQQNQLNQKNQNKLKNGVRRFVIDGQGIIGKNGAYLRVNRHRDTNTYKIINPANWTEEALQLFEQNEMFQPYYDGRGDRLEEANLLVTIAASKKEHIEMGEELEEEFSNVEEESEMDEQSEIDEESNNHNRKKRKWQIDMERCFINGQNIRHRLPRRNNNTWNGTWNTETKSIICKQNGKHYKSLSAFANAHGDHLKRGENKPPTKEDGWKTCQCQENKNNSKFWISCKLYRKNKLETM